METIYLNDYKGFSNQFIQLGDINFLVGENSTGKTSFLKIINLLSRQEFWMGLEFNNSEVELGYFNEIYNKKSSNRGKKNFQLGIEKLIKFRGDKFQKIRILLNFDEKESVPNLFQAKVCFSDLDILISFTDKQIRYRVKDNKIESFKDWVTDYDFPKSYKILGRHKRLPLFLVITMINLNQNEDHGQNFPLYNLELFEVFKWIAPIRAKAKRIYESYKIKFSPEGDHIPSLLRKIITNNNNTDKKRMISTLESFGKQSNLFDKIIVKELGEKNVSPFEILITYKNVEMKLPNVGYGVSQSLPLVIEILSSKRTMFSIQQPEVHLHPKAQAAFGSFLYNSIKNDKNRFIIETHSEFTINRFRYELLQKSSDTDDEIKAKVLFFERVDTGNKITEINISKKGTFVGGVPDTYSEFFIDEELRLLEL